MKSLVRKAVRSFCSCPYEILALTNWRVDNARKLPGINAVAARTPFFFITKIVEACRWSSETPARK